MPAVIAVCKSNKKAIPKKPVTEGLFKKDFGLEGDAHAEAHSHRQVSLLAQESIDKMNQLGLDLHPGDFAENITTEGIDLPHLPIGARLSIGDEVIMEVTQIGKECHTACAIRKKVGNCIMPTEGIFARIIKEGIVKPGDKVEVYGDLI